ncbi:DNA-dependent protein kinase catalytic subunit-like [Clytia hemisphaerica]|uniref:DNA-dependent protein kinase catalytic subunit-like n=1 Tax=Clytia hemisphaerica TaxID=252671 RepID=UPI0034D59348
MQKFSKTLSSSQPSAKELSMAINGYGKLSEACKEYMPENEMKKMFEEIIKRTEQCFMNLKGRDDSDLHQLPTFLEALLRILNNLPEISQSTLNPLERILITLFDYYPWLGKNGQFVFKRGFTMFVQVLAGHPSLMKYSLGTLLYQCLIRSCSHALPELQQESGEEETDDYRSKDVQISYKTFLPLWIHLIDHQNYNILPMSEEESRNLKEIVYDGVINAVLSTLNKLNLTAQKESTSPSSDTDLVDVDDSKHDADPTSGLVATMPNDFQVFVNIVEFVRGLISTHSMSSFERWQLVFVENVITLSSRYPLVSGFYKLLQTTCQIIEKIKPVQREELENTPSSVQVDQERIITFLRAFMKEILSSAQQYKDDLLVSCLQFLISVPYSVVQRSLKSYASIFKLTFELGLTQFELADVALSTLEKWYKESCSDRNHTQDMNDLLSEILPSLDDYLRSELNSNEPNEDFSISKASMTRSEKKVKRVPIRYLKALIKANKQSLQSPLEKLKLRILRFIGSLGGISSTALAQTTEDASLQNTIAWNNEELLSFQLPFPDMKAAIYLDSFLPRVVELAQTSVNRQTKVVACELLHALVLFMIGKSVHDPIQHKKQVSMEALYKRVFPAILKLACGSEQVAEQLFSPLVFQIIHWMSGNTKYESPETVVLLNTLLDGVANEDDCSLRDFSAKCIKEFFQWSIKHLSPKQLEKNPANPKSLFKRLSSLALHPSPFKRLGAAICFNNIYSIFREEDTLVSKFTLELLVVYIKSLSLAHKDEVSLGTVEQCQNVLNHLEKIIKKKAKMFLKAHKDRNVPTDVRVASKEDFTVYHINLLLIKYCGAPQTACRHACMKLFNQFLPLQEDVDSVSNWMKAFANKEGGKFFTARCFEKGGISKAGIINFPTLTEVMTKNQLSMESLSQWLENLLAALDNYCWVLGAKYLTCAQLLKDNPRTNLLKSLSYFLDTICLNTIEGIFKNCNLNDDITITPNQLDAFNKLRCTVVVRIINFLTLSLFDGYITSHQNQWIDVLNEKFFRIVTLCIMKPSRIGFNITDKIVLEKLPSELEKFSNALMKFGPLEVKKQFTDALKLLLKQPEFDLLTYLPLDLTHSIDVCRTLDLGHLLSGLMFLSGLNVLNDLIPTQNRAHLHASLLDTLTRSLVPLQSATSSSTRQKTLSTDPQLRSLSENILRFVLILDAESKKIVHLLLDTSTITLEGHTDKRGSTFYHSFPQIFNEHFISTPNLFNVLVKPGVANAELILTIIHGICNLILRTNDKERNKNSMNFCRFLASNLTNLSHWSHGDDDLLVLVLQITKLLVQIHPDVIKEKGLLTSTVQIGFKEPTKSKLAVKSRACDVIPHVLKHCSRDQTEKVCQMVKNYVAEAFPFSSEDLTVGTTKYLEYMAQLDQLCRMLTTCGEPGLFKAMISIMVRETKEVYQQKIEPILLKLIKSLEEKKKASEVFNYCMEVFKDEISYTNHIRQMAIERLCLPLLEHTSSKTLEEFFVTHIRYLVNCIEEKFNKYVAEEYEKQIINKTCAFKVISLMYQKLDKQDFTSMTSPILLAFLPKPATGKELTTAISKNASSAHKEDMRGETLFLEMRRLYHCAAYNCIISIISCTQVELKFYTGLLFTENVAKGQFLLENLIDTDREYKFESVLNSHFDRKQTLSMLRRNKEDDGLNNAKTQSRSRGKTNAGYLSTQFLMETSLSQDVNRFDFNDPIEAYSNYSTNNIDSIPANSPDTTIVEDNTPLSPDSESSNDPSTLAPTSTLMEMDELNQHENMPILLSLIHHMKNKQIYKPPTDTQLTAQPPPPLPSWMVYLQKKLASRDTHVNIKLFIAKLIINEPKIFEPYGTYWYPSLVDLILSSHIPGPPINYFTIDLVVVMLSWSKTNIPPDTVVSRNMCSSLLEYLVKYTHHTNRSVLKNNLQVIKTLLQVWKDRLQIPYQLIHTFFNNQDSEKKDNSTGLQLLGLVIKAGFSPFAPQSSAGLSKHEFFTNLTNCLHFKYKEVYATAAEVCGLALNYYQEHQEANELEFLLGNVSQELSNHSKKNKDLLVLCVFHMQSYYPNIVDRYIAPLLYCVTELYGVLRTNCIQALTSRVQHLTNEQHQEIYKQIQGKDLEGLLSHRDKEAQSETIRLIHGMLPNLTTDQLSEVLPLIANLQQNEYTSVRELTYDVFIWIYENCREDESRKSVLQLSKEVLVLGINDSNTKLSLKVLNFWRDESNLPKETIERTIEVVRALYSSKTEREYLSYASNLIMQLTSLSPDYTLPLFPNGLDSDEHFRNFNVNFSWQRQQTANMTPLFIATQRSTASQGSYSLTQKSHGEFMGIRATQTTFDFTQTQQKDNQTGSLNWMNPTVQVDSSLSTLSNARQSSPTSILSDTPMVIDSIDGRPINARRRPSQSQNPDKAADILRLKRKFLKDQMTRNQHFAAIEIKRQKMREVAMERRKAAKDKKVSMYRKYRVGELPDIQIKHSELIVPLQALSQLDSKMGTKLFTSVLNAIISNLPEKLDENSVDRVYRDLEQALDIMLRSSTINESAFTSALQNLCYTNKQLKLEPGLISTSSTASMQQPVGILLLEKQLLSNMGNGEKSAKRRRMESEKPEDVATWLEVSRLYESIDDFDWLRSVFSSHVSQSETTKNALSAETQNNYELALSLYKKATEENMSNENTPTESEEEYLDNARMRCYQNLCLWDKLKKFTTSSAAQLLDQDDSVGEGGSFDAMALWKDDELQETHLPYYIQSNIKLLCQGKVDHVSDDFDSFITNSLKEGAPKEHLQGKYSLQLALLNIFKDDLGAGEHFLNISSQQFLSEWSVLSTLVSASRQKKLEQLQKIVELEEYISMRKANGHHQAKQVESLLNTWSNRLPSLKAPLHVWDDIVMTRCSLIRKLKSANEDDLNLSKYLDGEETKNILFIADVARKQGNLAVCNQYLKESYNGAISNDQTMNLSFQWRYIYSKLLCDKIKMVGDKRKEKDKLDDLVSAFEQMEKCRQQHDSMSENTKVQYHLLLHKIWNHLTKVVKQSDDLFYTENEGRAISKLGQNCSSRNEFLSRADGLCKEHISQCLIISKELVTNDKESRDVQVKAMIKMYQYSDDKLKSKGEVDAEDADNVEHAMNIVQNLLSAMKLNSDKARLRFPRLLQVVEKFVATRDEFTKAVKEIPCWMFLDWINQIVAVIDKPIQECVQPILKGVARAYPQALMYPLGVCKDQLAFDGTVEGQKMRKFFEELSNTIRCDLLQPFSDALLQMTHPNLLLKDLMEELGKHVETRDQRKVKDFFRQNFAKFFIGETTRRGRDSAPGTQDSMTSSSTSSSSGGSYYFEAGSLGKKLKDIVKKELGKDGEKLVGMSLSGYMALKAKILKQLENHKDFRGNLQHFSPWLSQFQADMFNQHLEIPGQYSGKRKPMLEYHVKIAGFDEKILIMSSIRKPKRLTIRGNDQREYKFLVKGGEDLRQDQRIEQVFELMNTVFGNDAGCRNHRMLLKTYKVIPVTQRVGLIEWVDNTQPYKTLLMGAMTDREQKAYNSSE